MGWEPRHGRLYYYKSVRVGDRVRKVYLGSGKPAHVMELLDAEAARNARAEAAAIRAEADRLRPLEATMDTLDRGCRGLIEATLLGSGFHPHRRSWRKNRAARPTGNPGSHTGK